jgi:hypothetical protein
MSEAYADGRRISAAQKLNGFYFWDRGKKMPFEAAERDEPWVLGYFWASE